MLDNIILPPWHSRDPSLVFTAIKTARANAPHLEQLISGLLARSPRLVRASYDLKTGTPSSGMATLASVVSAPWISFDSSTARNVLVLDIDHPDGPDLVMELPPHIRPHIIIDPWSGRSAGIVVLKTPVLTGPGSKPGPQLLAQYAHALLKTHFRANDDRPSGSLTKNPFGLAAAVQGHLVRRTAVPSTPPLWEAWVASQSRLMWHTIMGAQEVELRDIVKVLGTDDPPPEPARRKIYRGQPSQDGRNAELFDTVRFWCYDNVAKEYGLIFNKALEINTLFSVPLPHMEVVSTAKSISKWMKTKYRPKARPKNEGVMKLYGTELTIKEKQKLAALRTNDIKLENTDVAIARAFQLWPDGVKMTQASLAKAAGVSIITIKRRWSSIICR